MKKIKVLIVDDSALVRDLLKEILDSDPEIEVVGTAMDPYLARNKIKSLNPDVITLDIEMPKMDGITFLKNLMKLRPMPVVMISTLTEKGADITLEALEIGAIDFLPKPKLDLRKKINEYKEEIIQKVKGAARAKVRPYKPSQNSQVDVLEKEVAPKQSVDAVLKKKARPSYGKDTQRIIAIGASTGGTEAIRHVLTGLNPDLPPIVIAQHIPESFSKPFANRMNGACQFDVHEAEDGQLIQPGHVYISPGSHHLIVVRKGSNYYCKLHDGPRVNRHKPSVDVLFRSVADAAGPHSIGVILTGMGDDGARGLKELHDTGAPTIAQDENTSVVWGMPGVAVRLGGVDQILPLGKVARGITKLASKKVRQTELT